MDRKVERNLCRMPVNYIIFKQLKLFLHTPAAFTGEGSGSPLQYFCLENPMDGEAWWAAVHGVLKSQTWLSNFTFTSCFHALEKEMETHSSVLAWRIPGTGEPGGLPSMVSHRVRHDWSDLAVAAATELKCTWMGELNSDDHYIYCCGQESLTRNGVAT